MQKVGRKIVCLKETGLHELAAKCKIQYTFAHDVDAEVLQVSLNQSMMEDYQRFVDAKLCSHDQAHNSPEIEERVEEEY